MKMGQMKGWFSGPPLRTQMPAIGTRSTHTVQNRID
jgi:hypothetical protein